VELAGLTFGVVGFGAIGKEVARLANAFGMKVLVTTRSQKTFPDYVTPISLELLLARSDVVSLHCPLTEQTRQLINASRLVLMKPTAFLINTGRGPLIDETALAATLNADKLAGAGLDVLSIEPPSPDHPLLTAKNCVITPHLAWGTRAARERLFHTVVENLEAFFAGKPQNVVN
jgi:glycerate dehydrogenase